MNDDPKDPNAWWAVKLPSLREMLPMNINKVPKKRPYWLVPLVVAIVSAEIFLLHLLSR